MERTCRRVLIVDDDLDLLGAMEQAFAASGYQVLAAADADEGLWLLSRRSVDLVITAVILPGRAGLDVIAAVKPPARVIATSGADWSAPSKYLTAARGAGADDVLAKPFEMEALLALAERQLGCGRRAG